MVLELAPATSPSQLNAQGGVQGNWQAAKPGGSASAGWKNLAANGLMAQSPVIQGLATAASGLTEGVGKVVQASLDHAAAELQADQKELEAKASTERAQAEEMQAMQQGAVDLSRDVRQKLAEINDSNNRTMNRILQG